MNSAAALRTMRRQLAPVLATLPARETDPEAFDEIQAETEELAVARGPRDRDAAA